MKRTFLISIYFFLAVNIYAQWQLESILPYDSIHSPVVRQVFVVDTTVAWATGTMWIGQNSIYPYIARKTLNGWHMLQTDLDTTVRGRCIAAKDSMNVWLGTEHPEEIYYSSNGGINWTLQLHIADTGHVYEIMFCRQNPRIGYAVASMAFTTMWNGVMILKTTNSGVNWQIWEFENWGFRPADRSMAVIDSNRAWFGVSNLPGGLGKIINTTNGGLSWTVRDVFTAYGGPFSIQFSQDNNTGVFFAQDGIYSWIYRTTNSGVNWNIVYSTTYYYSKSMRWIPGTSNLYGCSEFVIINSTDEGLTWRNMTGGPGDYLESLDAVRLNNETIYALAVTRNRKVYKLLDSVRVIGIENTSTTIPKVFKLFQNYPNPFNPVTLINYSLKEEVRVKIIIYDILGKVIRNLVNENQDAGYKSVVWNGTNNFGSSVATGLYIYKIEAGNFIDSKKMLLLN